jgi:hypothetical protein
MKQSPPLKGKRVRGYRIHVFRGTRHQPPSITTPLMWRESVPVAEWQRIISDPSTMQAYIIRSGRKMKAYQYSRQDVSK